MLQTFTTKLTNKTQLNGNVYLFHFDLIEPKEIEFQAGQYIVLQVPKNGDYVSRIYSIASSPLVKNSFELLIELLPGGIGSGYFNNLNIGDSVVFKGPAGMFTLNNESQNNLVFFATGTGLAPIRSMVNTILSSNFQFSIFKQGQILVFWGLQHYANVYLIEELKEMSSKYPNFQFRICLSREESLDKIPVDDRKYFILGRINNGFDKFTLNNCDYYVCGSREVTESLKQYLLDKGTGIENIHFEKY